MTKRTFTRKELYDLVWSKPVIHIAKEYGFSDTGIRKICIKHNIPLPKSGYWAKIKHQKKVTKEKFIKQDDNPIIRLENSSQNIYKGNHMVSEIAIRKKELDKIKELSLKVPDKLFKPHKYIIITKEYHKQLKIVKKRGGWSHEVDSSQALSINVSDNLFSRGLRILDSLIKLFEKRGYIVDVKNNSQVTIKRHSYKFRLTEKQKRVKDETDSWNSFNLIPTGMLCLKIDSTYPIKEWSDTLTNPIENRFGDILAWLELRAQKDEEQKISSELWQKQYEEKRQKEKDLQILKDKELSQFEKLFNTATRWHKSQYIRDYVNEFEKHATSANTLDSEKKEWINWAKEKADWYDPFVEKDLELLKNIDRDTLKPIKKSFFN